MSLTLTKEEIEQALRLHFQDAQIKLQDLTGGGDHWQVDIKSSVFQGKTLVEQHQLVYKALGKWMNNQGIHALALNTSIL